MTGKWIWRMVFALLIITGLALGGAAVYKAGFTHGVMTNLTLPEGSEQSVTPYGVPFGHMYYGRGIGPRAGLFVLFPLLCFGGFFLLLLIGGAGFYARRRAWMHDGPGAYPYWKHHGPPSWGPGKPPWTEDQSQPESGTPKAESEE